MLKKAAAGTPISASKNRANKRFEVQAATSVASSSKNGSNEPPDRPKSTEKLEISAAAERLIDAAVSEATKRGYESDLRHFAAAGLSIPATVEQVVEYLAKHAEKHAVGTLERRLISLHKVHRENLLDSPVHDSLVKRTMAGIRRTYGVKQRRVKPLVRDELLEMLVLVDRQKPVRAARDRALLLLGFAGAFRRSELVAICVEHVAHVDGGIEVFLPKSKTDQECSGRTVFVPSADGERCPVRALVQWLEIASISEGAIFRAVSRSDFVAANGLTAQSVALVIKSAVDRVGGLPKAVSGHSLRAGYCTTAAMQGLSNWQIRETTGHTNDAMLSTYVRPITRRKVPSVL
jgi:integrase